MTGSACPSLKEVGGPFSVCSTSCFMGADGDGRGEGLFACFLGGGSPRYLVEIRLGSDIVTEALGASQCRQGVVDQA